MDLAGAAAWLERVADADFLRVAAERGRRCWRMGCGRGFRVKLEAGMQRLG